MRINTSRTLMASLGALAAMPVRRESGPNILLIDAKPDDLPRQIPTGTPPIIAVDYPPLSERIQQKQESDFERIRAAEDRQERKRQKREENRLRSIAGQKKRTV